MNLVLIPAFGSVGAATSLLIAYGFLLGLVILLANRMLGLRTFIPQIASAAAGLAALTWVAQALLYR
jgi:hypothetical protein